MNLTRLEMEIAEDEGLRLRPYQDSEGYWTVGYGINLEAGELTERGARFLMIEKLAECVGDLEQFPFWHLANGPRRHALVNMRYNLGSAGFRGFRRMIAAANRGDWIAAAAEARDSKWYTQVGRRGPRVVTVLETGEHRV